MTPYISEISGDTLRIGGIGNYSPEKTFDCGQCFRFEQSADGAVTGIAHGRRLRIMRSGAVLEVSGISADEFENATSRSSATMTRSTAR